MEHKWASLACCLVVLGGALSLLPLIGTNFFPKDLHNVIDGQHVPGRGDADPPDQGRGDGDDRGDRAVDRAGRRRLHDLRRRRGAAILAVDRARAARRQLRPDPGPHPRQVPGRPRPLPCGSRRVLPRLSAGGSGWSSSRSRPARRSACPCRSASQGQDLATIERLGEQVKGFMREFPGSTDIQDDWDPADPPARAAGRHRPGQPRRDHASGRRPVSWAAASPGSVTTRIRERDRLIPVTLKLRPDERSRVEDLMTLEAHGAQIRPSSAPRPGRLFRTEMVRAQGHADATTSAA